MHMCGGAKYPIHREVVDCRCFCVFLFSVFETGSCYVAQADPKLMIVLPMSPENWDYRREPLCTKSVLYFFRRINDF
jgi:hypothetical protein